MGGLYGDGIIGLKGAFSLDFADQLEPIIQHHVIEGLLEPDYG
jgi:hypothetical protein